MRWCIICLFLEIPHEVVHFGVCFWRSLMRWCIWCLFLEIPHEVVHLVFVF